MQMRSCLADLKIKGEVSVSSAKKNIAINSEGGVPVIEMTNEYGNSTRYEISDSRRFDSLLANLWQFVKDSQH
jgi:hypothetical protein